MVDATQQRAEVLALDVLHGEELKALGFTDVVYPTNVGMRDLSGHAHFAPKPFEREFVLRELLGKKLQGDGLIESEVVGMVHLTHAALSHSLDDAVTAENAARAEAAMRIFDACGRLGFFRRGFSRGGGKLIERLSAGRAKATPVGDRVRAGWAIHSALRPVKPPNRSGFVAFGNYSASRIFRTKPKRN